MAPRRVPPLVAQNVRMGPESLTWPRHQHAPPCGKACRRERRPPLAGEHERRIGILLALQLAQGPQFIADNRMGGRRALLEPLNVQEGLGKIDRELDRSV